MERKLWISLIEIQHVINVLEQNPKDIDVKFFSAFILEQVLDRLMWVYVSFIPSPPRIDLINCEMRAFMN
jgi:hypothetical protein